MCRVDGCGRGRGCGSASYESLVVVVGCCLLLQEIRVLCMLCHCYNWLQLLEHARCVASTCTSCACGSCVYRACFVFVAGVVVCVDSVDCVV